MTQSALTSQAGLHVAVIMDGNGRWATARGLPRTAGHVRGAEAVRRTVEAAPDLGIRTLSLYAFSSDNWRRPTGEVRVLLRLFARHLRSETPTLAARGVRLRVIGRRDRLPGPLVAAIERAERRTAGGRALELRIAIDYSARDAIIRAASRLAPGETERTAFARRLGEACGADGAPDVDLVVRTGGEQRLSDFLLWECAYAELYFTPRAWPDFDREDLAAAVADFRGRTRRFGDIAAATDAYSAGRA
ncbi:MAG: di-trans,poly-cis-decaprenylcistransferase [Candidatus Rokuibacteriota bacterium]|nr:MAG: di-trans,poly-cis-decaprenylcistransferase [Candidatus Rokubacteria bacterium]PYN25766.1 MAG: di-trans,poly-cis-decaprenylcistransferase [Candidatus Rokubacteria bacterium]